jgi:cytidyltransferase-like protein
MNKEKALFVGKFNPPHIGHAFTILKLMKKYDLTIVVTNDIPKNAYYTQEQIYNEMKNFNIPVIKVDFVLTKQKQNPFSDIILSGNPNVIKWCKKVNAKYEFIPRSGKIEARKMR